MINRWLVGTRNHGDQEQVCILALKLELPRQEALQDIAHDRVAERRELTGVVYDPGASAPLQECKCDYVHMAEMLYERRPRAECAAHPGERDTSLVGSYPYEPEHEPS